MVAKKYNFEDGLFRSKMRGGCLQCFRIKLIPCNYRIALKPMFSKPNGRGFVINDDIDIIFYPPRPIYFDFIFKIFSPEILELVLELGYRRFPILCMK